MSGAALRRVPTDGVPQAPRHFLDIRDCDSATLRHMLDTASTYKTAGPHAVRYFIADRCEFGGREISRDLRR